jgi:hypothetical protein
MTPAHEPACNRPRRRLTAFREEREPSAAEIRDRDVVLLSAVLRAKIGDVLAIDVVAAQRRVGASERIPD